MLAIVTNYVNLKIKKKIKVYKCGIEHLIYRNFVKSQLGKALGCSILEPVFKDYSFPLFKYLFTVKGDWVVCNRLKLLHGVSDQAS